MEEDEFSAWNLYLLAYSVGGTVTTMSEMGLAHFNVFWFAGLVLPAALMLFASGNGVRSLTVFLVLVSIAGTYVLGVLACERKWDLRVAYVWEKYDLANEHLGESMPEEAEYAFADGANMVFTAYLFAPIEALIATLFWYAVGRAWRRRRVRQAPQVVDQFQFKDQY